MPVGATKPKAVDIRLVAATNKELATEVKFGRFRKDLYYRLNVINLTLPPLRERKEDIEPLTRHFIGKYSRRTKKRVSSISNDALRLLAQYSWPGNVRELENVIERAVILARGEQVTADLFPLMSPENPEGLPETGETSLESVERRQIMKILKKTGFHRSRAAEELGITRKTLSKKIAEYGLSLPGDAPVED